MNHVANSLKSRPMRAPSARPPHWAVACDFDGTVTIGDFTDRLLERYALPSWRAIEDQWRQGRIGSRECMLRQIDLVRCTPAQLAELIDETQLESGFDTFVGLIRERRIPLRIVSDGLDAPIIAILRRHGFAGLPIFANRLIHTGPDRYRIAFPNAREDCTAASGMCKCALAAAGPRRAARTLLIGDGASDFCAARSADFVLAKGALADYCRRQGIGFAPFTDFHDVCRLLTALLDGATPERLEKPAQPNEENMQHEPQ